MYQQKNGSLFINYIMDVAAEVQLILESFINPKNLKKMENVPALLEKRYLQNFLGCMTHY